MAIHHTRIKTYSRAKGHSAIAAAAYRGGYLLTDPNSGARHDYRGRAGIIQSRCMAPLGSPAWADDPQHFGPLQKRQSDAAIAPCAETSPSRCRTSLMTPSAGSWCSISHIA
ncbi:MobA/MobL family protein [Xanthomonas hortorum pv. vitians]|nr:MobA/MobL family protein [Xanthomonas hortorum]MCE4517581.1 MobA/MobL family protein [Xanthomonas hortorum pv. vitians]